MAFRECCEKPEKGNKYGADELKVYIRKQKEIRKQRELQEYEQRQELLESKKQRLRELDVKCKQIAMSKRLEKKTSVPSSYTQYHGGGSRNSDGGGATVNVHKFTSNTNTKSMEKTSASSRSSSKPKVKRTKYTSGYQEGSDITGTELKASKSNCKLEREAANFIFKEFENIVRRECRNILKTRSSVTSVNNNNNNNNATTKSNRNSIINGTCNETNQHEEQGDQQQQQQFLQPDGKSLSSSRKRVDKGVGTSFLLHDHEIELPPGMYENSSDGCSQMSSDYVKPVASSKGFHSLFLDKSSRKQHSDKRRSKNLPYVHRPSEFVPESTKHAAASKIQAAYKSYKIRSILSEAKLRAYKSFHSNNSNSDTNNYQNQYYTNNENIDDNILKHYDRRQLENLSSDSMVNGNRRRKMTFYKPPGATATNFPPGGPIAANGEESHPEKPYDQNRFSHNNNSAIHLGSSSIISKTCPVKPNPEDIPGYIPPPAGFSGATTPRTASVSPRILPLLRLKPIDEPFPKQVLDSGSLHHVENQNLSPAVSPLKLISSISKFQFPYSAQAASSKDFLPSSSSIKVINDNVLQESNKVATNNAEYNNKNHYTTSPSSRQHQKQEYNSNSSNNQRKSCRTSTSMGTTYVNGESSSSPSTAKKNQSYHQKLLSTSTYMDLPDPAFSAVLQEKVRLFKVDSSATSANGKHAGVLNNINNIDTSRRADSISNHHNNTIVNGMTDAIDAQQKTTTTNEVKSKSPTRRTQMNAVSKATEQIKKKIVEAKQILEDYKQELLRSSSVSSMSPSRPGGGDDLTYESDFDTEIRSQSQSLSQIQNSLFGHDSEILSSVALDNNNLLPLDSKAKKMKRQKSGSISSNNSRHEILSSASSSVSSIYQNIQNEPIVKRTSVTRPSKTSETNKTKSQEVKDDEKFVESQSEGSEYEQIQKIASSQEENLKSRHKNHHLEQQQMQPLDMSKKSSSSSRKSSSSYVEKKERKKTTVTSVSRSEREKHAGTLSEVSSTTHSPTLTSISSAMKSASSKKRSSYHHNQQGENTTSSRKSEKVELDEEGKQISREVEAIISEQISDNSELFLGSSSTRSGSKSKTQRPSVSKSRAVARQSQIQQQQQQLGSVSSASSNLATEDIVYESDFDTDLQSPSKANGGQNNHSYNNNTNNSHQDSQILSSIVVDFVLSDVKDPSIAENTASNTISNTPTVTKEGDKSISEKLKSISRIETEIDESLPKSEQGSNKRITSDKSSQAQPELTEGEDDGEIISNASQQQKRSSVKQSQSGKERKREVDKEIEELDTNVSFSLASNIPEDIPYDVDFETDAEESQTQTSPLLGSARKQSEKQQRAKEKDQGTTQMTSNDLSSVAENLVHSEIEESKEEGQNEDKSFSAHHHPDNINLSSNNNNNNNKINIKELSSPSISINSSSLISEIDEEIEKKLEWAESLMQGSRSISSDKGGKRVASNLITPTTTTTATTTFSKPVEQDLIENDDSNDSKRGKDEEGESLHDISGKIIEQVDSTSCASNIIDDVIQSTSNIVDDHDDNIEKSKISVVKPGEFKERSQTQEKKEDEPSTSQLLTSSQVQSSQKSESCQTPQYSEKFESKTESASSSKMTGIEKISASSQFVEPEKNQNAELARRLEKETAPPLYATSFKSEMSQMPEVSEKSIVAELPIEGDDVDEVEASSLSKMSQAVEALDKSSTIQPKVKDTEDNSSKGVLASSVQTHQVGLKSGTTQTLLVCVVAPRTSETTQTTNESNEAVSKIVDADKVKNECSTTDAENNSIVQKSEKQEETQKMGETIEEVYKEKPSENYASVETESASIGGTQDDEYSSASHVSNFHVEDVVYYESDFDTDVPSEKSKSTRIPTPTEPESKNSSETTDILSTQSKVQEQEFENIKKEDDGGLQNKNTESEGDCKRTNDDFNQQLQESRDEEDVVRSNLKTLVEDKGKLEAMIGRIITRMIKEVTRSRNESIKETPVKSVEIIIPESQSEIKIKNEKVKRAEEEDDEESSHGGADIDVEEAEWFEDDLGGSTDPAEEESLKREAAEIVAEQIRKLETEIQQLEALQAKVPTTLLNLSDIPDKPPPPYSPDSLPYSLRSFSISYTSKQLQDLVVTQVDSLWKTWTETGKFPKYEMDFSDDKSMASIDGNTINNRIIQKLDKETSGGDTPLNQATNNQNQMCDIKDVSVLSTRAFRHLLFHLIQDTIKEVLQIEDIDSPLAKDYVDKIRPGSLSLAAQKMRIPKTREVLIETVLSKTKNLLPCNILPNSVRQRLTKWTSRPRDLVDEILAEELIQEDREWTENWPEEILVLEKWTEKYTRRAISEVIQAFRTVYS